MSRLAHSPAASMLLIEARDRGLRIVTQYDPPPIPGRCFDWSAITDEYDGAPDAGPRARAIGWGATEEEAVRDLVERLET